VSRFPGKKEKQEICFKGAGGSFLENPKTGILL
jgi:hypothetical protein